MSDGAARHELPGWGGMSSSGMGGEGGDSDPDDGGAGGTSRSRRPRATRQRSSRGPRGYRPVASSGRPPVTATPLTEEEMALLKFRRRDYRNHSFLGFHYKVPRDSADAEGGQLWQCLGCGAVMGQKDPELTSYSRPADHNCPNRHWIPYKVWDEMVKVGVRLLVAVVVLALVGSYWYRNVWTATGDALDAATEGGAAAATARQWGGEGGAVGDSGDVAAGGTGAAASGAGVEER